MSPYTKQIALADMYARRLRERLTAALEAGGYDFEWVMDELVVHTDHWATDKGAEILLDRVAAEVRAEVFGGKP